jgi:hypothetical protein
MPASPVIISPATPYSCNCDIDYITGFVIYKSLDIGRRSDGQTGSGYHGFLDKSTSVFRFHNYAF